MITLPWALNQYIQHQNVKIWFWNEIKFIIVWEIWQYEKQKSSEKKTDTRT